MGNAVLAWWMVYWRLAFLSTLVSYQWDMPQWILALFSAGVVSMLRRSHRRVHIFPIIRALRGRPILTDSRTGQPVPLREAFRDSQQPPFPYNPPQQVPPPHQQPPFPYNPRQQVPPPHQQPPVAPQPKQPRPAVPLPWRAKAQPTPQPEGQTAPTGTLREATRPGELTGFEPAALAAVPLSLSYLAHGFAGDGLHTAGFSDGNRRAGQQGEMGFYRVLVKEDLLDRFSSFWSVMLPSSDGSGEQDPKYKMDVDCVIVSGMDILLIDLKFYRAGDVTWEVTGDTLVCRDNATGAQVGKEKTMSRSMALAQSRYRGLFPQANVSAYVVLMPADTGAGRVASGTMWAGGVPLLNLTDMLPILRALPESPADPSVEAKILRFMEPPA